MMTTWPSAMSDSDMRHHYREPAPPPSDFRLGCGAVRAFFAAIVLVLGAGCAAPEPPSPPTREGELRAAWESYAAFCGACPDASACCLREADFSGARYSAASGRYLRALREHYECRRGDLLIDASVYSDPLVRYPEDRTYARLEQRAKLSCERSACEGSAEIMAAELDHALASATKHSRGAIVACP